MWPFKRNKKLTERHLCRQCEDVETEGIYCSTCKSKQIGGLVGTVSFVNKRGDVAVDIKAPEGSPPVETQGLPCPAETQMFGQCICMTCTKAKICPMEAQCRLWSCHSTIGGCTAYTNGEDPYGENKRVVFKDGAVFEPVVFRFTSKRAKEGPGIE